MKRKLFFVILLILASLFAGCDSNSGPVVISVDKTPVFPSQETTPTPKAAEEPTPTVTPEPTPGEESYVYIEDLELNDRAETMYFGNWEFGGTTKPFKIGGQSYNKGIGMFVKSKKIEDEKASISSTWALDRDYHKITFDLGCEQTIQYGGQDKYGTFGITVYAGESEIWDSGLNDYKFTAIGKELDIPEGARFITVTLTQTKGINGTLNVVLGSFKLYYYK